MLKRFTRVVAMLAIPTMVSCSGLRVQNDWDPSVDFSRFQTFTILVNEEPAMSPLIDRRIRAAIGDQLDAEGLREVGSIEEADLAIGYQVATEQRHTYQTVSTGWHSHGFRHSRRSHWHGTTMASSTTRRRAYTVGSLVIAVFDAESMELVWEGSGSRRISASSNPEQSRQRILDAVQRVMRDFPPPAAPGD
ncbi:MAG: DUF4136 domain-containing protein [Deltaproteobacteria bacterium]|jgi:hypothetical protein|nr:DUF4136 domain-containing protein [Deltaproteobacteria bacterium]MBW2496270.1 DUF4136 domain-containing protein [Deltaproteobacteria bacterium]